MTKLASRYSHLTDIPFACGDLLLPQADGYCHQLAHQDVEKQIKQYRPATCLSRYDAAFLIPAELQIDNLSYPRDDYGQSGDTFY